MLFPPSARKVSLFVVKSELNFVLKAFLMRLTWDRMAQTSSFLSKFSNDFTRESMSRSSQFITVSCGWSTEDSTAASTSFLLSSRLVSLDEISLLRAVFFFQITPFIVFFFISICFLQLILHFHRSKFFEITIAFVINIMLSS